MRVLVTGGAGFIGSNVVDVLVTVGHQVCVFDDLSSGKRENIPSGVELVVGDITTDALDALVARWQPAAIIHHAAQISVRRSVDEPLVDGDVNVLGTVRLARAAALHGVRTFIFASTGGAIYGEQDVFPAPESHALRPVSPYGTSKLCAETYLDYFARTSTMRVVRLRYANVYGPRQDPHGEAGVVAIFAGLTLRGAAPTINGDGRQTRDYTYVGDVARANVLALDNGAAQGPINIGTGIETDVGALGQLIARAARYGGAFSHGPALPGEQRRSVLDWRHAERTLGWRPEVSLADGIGRTVAWFAARRS